MSGRTYLRPPWGQRHIGNRLAPLFQRKLLSKLSVQGRRSGRWHTVPVAVLDHEGERYLISYRGASEWARNLEVSHAGRLAQQGRVEEITVEEIPVEQRAAARGLHGALRTHADRRRRAAQAPGSSGPPDLPHRVLGDVRDSLAPWG
jgi:F420H(2)-dependent quinone reductase